MQSEHKKMKMSYKLLQLIDDCEVNFFGGKEEKRKNLEKGAASLSMNHPKRFVPWSHAS